MHSGGQEDSTVFDREHVLFGPLRDQVLDLDQVRSYGATMFGDPDAISLYGMAPGEWYAQGIRMRGRTTVECTRDRLAALIADDVAELARGSAEPVTLLVDPFTGSANTLYWLHAALPDAVALGVEIDPVTCDLAQHNLELVGCPIEMRNEHYADALAALPAGGDGVAAFFVGPPWGHALDPDRGLDLASTAPPVPEIVGHIVDAVPGRPLLVAVQGYERMEQEGLEQVRSLFDWSRVSTYAINPPGFNPATLLGTLGWTPSWNS